MTNAKQKPPPIIFIAGPTASGKSHLALALAETLGGQIVNADAMQVYDTLRILTARPDAQDEARVPHHLYGHIAAHALYNVARWQSDAVATIAAIRAQQNVPIVVGGTGLYFRSLTEGLAEIPDIDDDIRTLWRARLEAEGAPALYALLQNCDPDLAARLNPNDTQRILRGLEVYSATGRPLSLWQHQPTQAPFDEADIIKIVLNPDRAWLYQRCDTRFEQMMAQGVLEEIDAFMAQNVPMESPLRKALGVSELLMHKAGLCDAQTALLAAQQRTRRYAKRQMTWFRNQMAAWHGFTEQDYAQNYAKIFSFISKNGLTK